MKLHRPLSERQERLSERALFEAVLSLRDPDECRRFFEDLCTPTELQAMADRWAVVRALLQGVPYREIQRQTGVSVATVTRVARCLRGGEGGYAVAVKRLGLEGRQGERHA